MRVWRHISDDWISERTFFISLLCTDLYLHARDIKVFFENGDDLVTCCFTSGNQLSRSISLTAYTLKSTTRTMRYGDGDGDGDGDEDNDFTFPP